MVTVLIGEFYSVLSQPSCQIQIAVPVQTAPESLALTAVCIHEVLDGSPMSNVAVSASAHQQLASDARRALEYYSPRALHIQICCQHQTRCAGSDYCYIINHNNVICIPK